MPLIKKVIGFSLYLALGIYAFTFLFHFLFKFKHMALSPSRHLISGAVFLIFFVIIWLFTHSKLIQSPENVKWLNLFKIHYIYLFILSLPVWVIPNNQIFPNEYNAIVRILFIIFSIVFPLIFITISYFLFKKFPGKKFTTIPLAIYCLTILFFFYPVINCCVI